MKFTKFIAAAAALCLAAPAAVSTMTSALTPPPQGDVNGDFIFNLADIVMFQRWLNGKDNSRYIDHLVGLKLTWMFPITGRTSYDYYYY